MQSLYGPASTCGASAEGRQEPRDMLPAGTEQAHRKHHNKNNDGIS
ncbi:MAG: hypothetical protein O9331_05090 [Acidovorax sp.]|nr:hypothetical protein [Acidovorax sp.]